MTAATPTRGAHVLIAADSLPTRVGLRLALEQEARCTEAVDASSAVASAVRDRPDVCVIGLEATRDCLRAANEISSQVPSAAVILLTNRLDEDEFMAAVRVGASGYLSQSVDPDRLPHVVRDVLRGQVAVPRKFVSRLLDELRSRERRRSIVLSGRGRIDLTPREWEVVELLLRKATTTEIASTLGLAPVTVRRHLGSVERKLGVATRAEVVRLFAEGQGAATPA
jgi:DNA-binding NarL/FixJ family response regulator